MNIAASIAIIGSCTKGYLGSEEDDDDDDIAAEEDGMDAFTDFELAVAPPLTLSS